MAPARIPPLERFMRLHTPEPMSGCWLWTGEWDRKGYGVLRFPGDRSHTFAHRLSWRLHEGQIPDGLSVLHKCDVPACVNPEHLFLGTQADNISDAQAKGRLSGQKVTHCAHGHLLSGQNLIIKCGGRKCRICYNRAQMRRYYRRKAVA